MKDQPNMVDGVGGERGLQWLVIFSEEYSALEYKATVRSSTLLYPTSLHTPVYIRPIHVLI